MSGIGAVDNSHPTALYCFKMACRSLSLDVPS
jgi:hypothetical protein